MILIAWRTDGNHRYSWMKNRRSLLVNRTRPRTLRCSTVSCCRSAAFSASSRLLDLKSEATRFNNSNISAAIAADVKRFVRRYGRGFWYAQVLASATRQITATYYIPHLGQAPMEPPMATARVAGDTCEVWGSIQAPEAVRTDLAKRFHLPLEKITVHPLLLGGGFGRKSKPGRSRYAVRHSERARIVPDFVATGVGNLGTGEADRKSGGICGP